MKHPRVVPTVVHMLAEACELAPDREALVMGEERLTYREYARCAAGLAAELSQSGITGGRVVLIMKNSIDIAIAYFGVHASGAQVAALNPAYTPRELGYMIDDANAHAVILDEDLLEELAPLLGKTATRIVVGPKSRRLTQWRRESELESQLALPDPDTLATLQYTGGTTGFPKGVNLTHRAIAYNHWQRETLVTSRLEKERTLCVMPLFHVYAAHICMYAMVYARGAMVILPKYHPETVTDALQRERVTIFAGSPTIFNSLLAYDDFLAADKSSLHLSYSGSAALPLELLVEWEQVTGAPVLEGFGLSEAGPAISFTPQAEERRAGSVGIALPDTEIQIVDLDSGNTVLAAGQVGEIRVRGPQIMSDYRNLPEETERTIRGGFLYTGDIGELDEDGYLYIRGRKKEMILTSGFNVFPSEVEQVLYSFPPVREAAVVGQPDEYRGEVVVAYVVLGERQVEVGELVEYCTKNLASYKVPARIEVVDALPKTGIGKIDKQRLVARSSA